MLKKVTNLAPQQIDKKQSKDEVDKFDTQILKISVIMLHEKQKKHYRKVQFQDHLNKE